MNRSRLRFLLPAVLLLALARYLPAYAWAFVGDDYVQFGYIRELVEAPATFLRAFDPTWSTWYYRPLQNLWLLLLRLGFGLNPFPYYYLQGLWHLLAVALLYALARRLRLGRPYALAAAALFALHAHHQDVVGWVSAVATPLVVVFGLAAILAFQWSVAGERWSVKRALATVHWPLFTALALLSHESGILLPPFLLLLALACPRRRPRRDYALLGALLLGALALGAVHLFRPNLTLAVRETPAAAYLDPGELAAFLAVVLGRWSLLTRSAWGTALLNRLLGSPAGLLLPLGFGVLLAWLGYRLGARAAGLRRDQAGGWFHVLLLAWIALHLLFSYGALWVQAPELLGGRHLYAAWAGVALLLPLAARSGLRRARGRPRPGRRGRAARARERPLAAYAGPFLAGLLLAYLGAQIHYARAAEAEWLAHAREVAAVEAQMKGMLPAVTPETAVYAREFVITPAFAPYAAAVWYGQSGLAGGSLARLRGAGTLGPESYLFDYGDGELRELLPALHDYAASHLLWPETPAPVVAGPAGAARLALPAGQALTLTGTVPAGSHFYTAFSGPAGSRYRLLARPAGGGRESVLAAGSVPREPGAWQPLDLPLPRYWTHETTFILEAEGDGAWALPRLVQPATTNHQPPTNNP